MVDKDSNQPKIIHYNGVWHEASYFHWTEGNFGCDCNRSLFFSAWKSDSVGCGGNDNRFYLAKIVLEDGTEVLVDVQDESLNALFNIETVEEETIKN